MQYSSRRCLVLLVMGISGLGCMAADTSVAQQIKQSSYHRNAERSVAQQLSGGTPALQAQLAGGRSAISVAVADFDRDGVTDLVTGYSVGGGGALTFQRGNSAAVAPTGSDFTAFVQGVIAPAFLPAATTFALPIRPDFLLAADVNGDGPTDLLAAAKGDTNAYLLTGRGSGNFNVPQAIALNGTVTALTTWRQANGSSLVLAGVCAASGCSLQAIDHKGVVKFVLALPGSATAIDLARINGGNLDDIAVAAGGKVLLFNGDAVIAGSTQSETLPVSNALTLAAGRYVYDARGMMQLAVLDSGGTLHVLARSGVDSHEYTPAELRALKPWGRGGAGESYVDPSPKPAGMPWAEVEALPNVGPGDGSVPLLVRGRLTTNGNDDLAVLSGSQVTQVAHGSVLTGSARVSAPVITQDSSTAPVLGAALARISPDPRAGLITADGSASPKIAVPETGGITFYVNTTTDANDTLTTANRCTNNVPSSTLQCTLRDAINLSTKSPSGPNTIDVPAGTYTITQQNPFSDNDSNNANYHFDVDSNVSIVGAGSATTIIGYTNAATSPDKVMSLNSSNNLGAANAYYTYTIALTGLMLKNGQNTNPAVDNSYGGNFDWEGKDGSLTLSDVTSTGGNVATNGDGGGMHADNYSGTTYSPLVITNSTFSNNTATLFGGGISVDDDVEASINYSTISGNTVSDSSGQGAGINLRLPAKAAQPLSSIGGSTISGNTVTNYQGGGMHADYGVSLTSDTFTNNTAAQGGGIHFFSQTTSGSVVDSTFTGNTGAVFLQSETSLETMSISYSRFHGNTPGSGDSAHTAVSSGGAVTATDNWWGCNPTTSATSIAGTNCDTAGAIASTPGTFSGNPFTKLILTLSTTTPTGAASFSATGSTAQDSSGNAYTNTEDNALSGVPAMLVITQPDSTATSDTGFLDGSDSITESATPDTGKVDYGSGASVNAAVTVDGFTVTTPYTLEESDLTVTSAHNGNIEAGGVGTYTLTVTNSGNSVTSGTITLSDPVPSGFTISSIVAGSGWSCTASTTTNVSCTLSTTLSAGGTSVVTVTVSVSSSDIGSYTNIVTVGGGGELDANNDTGTDTTLVVGAPTFSEAFSPTNIAANGTSTVTFTLGNPSANPVALTGVAFTDSLPTNLKVATPANASTTCTSGSVTAAAASTTISLSGASVNAGSTCTVTVNVTSATAGIYTNTTGTLNSTNGPTGPTASATLAVGYTAPGFGEAFSPTTITTGGTSTVTFTITSASSNPAAYTGLAFTDNLPTNLVVATPLSATTTCTSGTVTAVAGGTSISLSGGQIAPNTSCTVTVNVTSATAGSYTNTTGTLTDTQGVNGTTASAALTVLSPPTISIAFSPTTISPSANSTLTFTITNNNSSSLTGIAFSDTLPTGMVIATPNGLSGSCSFGTITATAGSGSVSLSGALITATSTCIFSVSVTSTTAGSYSNTTGAISSTNTGTGAASNTATLTVGDTIWILNGNMQLERLSESGTQLNQTSITATASTLGSIAFDNLGNAWVVGNADSKVYKYSATAGTVSSGVTTGGVNSPTGVAIDGQGNAWIANGNNTVSEIANGATAVSPSTGYQNGTGTLNSPTGILVDNAGSVWVINSGGNTVTKIIGAAAPAVTPTVTGVTNNTLGTRP